MITPGLQSPFQLKIIQVLYQNRAGAAIPFSLNCAISTICFVGMFFIRYADKRDTITP
jgi:hypothetical protein